MASAEQSKNYVTFTGGLNTEATVLNFPENAASELDNFDLLRTGEIKRRLAIDFEDNYVIRTESTSAGAVASNALNNSEWKAVNGKGNINFQVVQVGLTLYFHELGGEPTSNNLRGSVSLDTFKTQSDADTHVIDTAYGQGILICVNQGMDPVYIRYDDVTNTFTATRISIQVRDFEGVDDGLLTDERPTSLSLAHTYNLRNQGWPLSTTVALSRGGADGASVWDPIAATYGLVGFYPNNADQFWAARATAAKSGKEEVIGAYSPFILRDLSSGNTPAPRGHFIYDYFNQNKGSVSGIELPESLTTITSARPSATAFYAGRAWYFGVRSQKYTGDVLFSQIITDVNKIGRCYQDQDPTAEDLNALLASDGGVIHIAGMGEVFHAVEVGQDLVIIAENGLWAIRGSLGGNFKADDFALRKLTDNGSISRESIVVAENQLVWWSLGGIWVLQAGQIDDKFDLNRITKDTIQTFYEGLSQTAKAFARGFYDEFSKRVVWLYNDSQSYDGLTFRYKYNRALFLDMTLPAWYTYTISDLSANSPFVAAMSMKYPGSSVSQTFDILLILDTIELSGDIIVQDISTTQFANNKIKLLTFVQNEDTTYSYTFSEFKNKSFLDWATWDTFKHGAGYVGADYSSVIQTGWQDFQAPLNDKHITHVTTFLKKTETGFTAGSSTVPVTLINPSSLNVQTRWEWTDVDVSRWTVATECYRLNQYYIPTSTSDPFNYGYTIIKSKLRMRGHGHSFALRYTSNTGKDAHIIGFSVNLRGASKV
jgi:hypothetical protein